VAAFEDLEEMFARLRRRLLREAERILVETLQPDWTPDGGLRPLYTVYEYPDRYVILVDVPGADTSSINIYVTEDNRLVVEARLQRELSFSDVYGTVAGRELSIRYYKQEIPLPPDADKDNIKVNVRPNKIIEIVVPRRL
jgi:HSP20 family protein